MYQHKTVRTAAMQRSKRAQTHNHMWQSGLASAESNRQRGNWNLLATGRQSTHTYHTKIHPQNCESLQAQKQDAESAGPTQDRSSPPRGTLPVTDRARSQTWSICPP